MGSGFRKLAEHLKQVRDTELPKTYRAILQEVGDTSKRIAKEDLIGRTDPLPSITFPPTGDSFPAWEPHAEATPRIKAASGGGKGGDPSTYLYDTGEMYQSIDYTVISAEMVLGSDSDHAISTELGSDEHGKHVDPRPFLGPAVVLAAGALNDRMIKAIGRTLAGERRGKRI